MINSMVITAEQWEGRGKVLIFGNGGLAAEAEHFAAELMGKFDCEVYIPAIALTANTALLSALANDMGWNEVFAHQVRVLAQPGDLVIGMTTSVSANVFKGVTAAQQMGVSVLLLSGGVMQGKTVADKQEWTIHQLHDFAVALKRRQRGRSSTRQS